MAGLPPLLGKDSSLVPRVTSLVVSLGLPPECAASPRLAVTREEQLFSRDDVPYHAIMQLLHSKNTNFPDDFKGRSEKEHRSKRGEAS